MIKQCISCKQYTLSDVCSCGAKAVSPAPAKFSPDDKYASYRRKYKETFE